MESDPLAHETDPSTLREQLVAVRERHRLMCEELGRVELAANGELDVLTRLHADLVHELTETERGGDEQDHELDGELDAVARDVNALAQHLGERSRALHEELDAVIAEAHSIETEAVGQRGHQHERVTQVATRAGELHHAIETHRTAMTGATETAGHSLAETGHRATTHHHTFEQHLASLHQGTEQAERDTTSATEHLATRGHAATDELRERLGVVGGIIATATEHLQHSAEQAIEHEIHALIREAVQELKQLFDDLIARLGHNRQELSAARGMIEPLLHELETIVPGLGDATPRVNAHVEDVQRRREEEHHDAY